MGCSGNFEGKIARVINGHSSFVICHLSYSLPQKKQATSYVIYLDPGRGGFRDNY
ncbi:hypothetical protein [Coleofasciculus sp. F4-SAH-05]|uniref:hypothetical protein n=1 Tax=Coleofasciculus sp. F4-SAH-05 TaxID=3069525 RepID=UPI0032FD1600